MASTSRSGLAAAATARLRTSTPNATMQWAAQHGQTVGSAATPAATPTPASPVSVGPTGKLGWTPAAPAVPITAGQGMNEANPRALSPIVGGGSVASPVSGGAITTTPGVPAPAYAATANAATALPFDATGAADEATAAAQRNSYLNNLQQQQQTIEQQYSDATRTANEQHPDDLRQLLNQAAARGLVHSSGYGYQVGENERHFSDLLGRLASNHTQGINNLQAGEANYEGEYGARLQQIRAAAAERLAAQAGALGLGAADPGSITAGATTVGGTTDRQGAIGDTMGPALNGSSNNVPGSYNGGNPSDYRGAIATELPWHKPAPVAPPPAAAAAPAAPVMHDQLTRSMASFDPHSQNLLHGGQVVTAGNGYKYRSINGVPTRVA